MRKKFLIFLKIRKNEKKKNFVLFFIFYLPSIVLSESFFKCLRYFDDATIKFPFGRKVVKMIKISSGLFKRSFG